MPVPPVGIGFERAGLYRAIADLGERSDLRLDLEEDFSVLLIGLGDGDQLNNTGFETSTFDTGRGGSVLDLRPEPIKGEWIVRAVASIAHCETLVIRVSVAGMGTTARLVVDEEGLLHYFRIGYFPAACKRKRLHSSRRWRND